MAVGRTHPSNCRHAQGDEIAVWLCAVSLKVSMQPTLSLGHRQRVIRQCKVVHANVDITGGFKRVERTRQHGNLGRPRRQLGRHNASLRFETLRQMRVSIQGHAVRPELRHLGQCAIEGLRRLLRQSINQVYVDRLKTDLSRRIHQCKNLLGGLHPMDGFLNYRVKVLHPKTQTVKPQLKKKGQALGIHRARINFNRIFTPGGKIETASKHRQQTAELVIRQKSRRSAPQMQLTDVLTDAQMRRMQIHFKA